MAFGRPNINPFTFWLGFTRSDQKYMTPEDIGRAYGPKAQREAERRERERKEREEQ